MFVIFAAGSVPLVITLAPRASGPPAAAEHDSEEEYDDYSDESEIDEPEHSGAAASNEDMEAMMSNNDAIVEPAASSVPPDEHAGQTDTAPPTSGSFTVDNDDIWKHSSPSDMLAPVKFSVSSLGGDVFSREPSSSDPSVIGGDVLLPAPSSVHGAADFNTGFLGLSGLGLSLPLFNPAPAPMDAGFLQDYAAITQNLATYGVPHSAPMPSTEQSFNFSSFQASLLSSGVSHQSTPIVTPPAPGLQLPSHSADVARSEGSAVSWQAQTTVTLPVPVSTVSTSQSSSVADGAAVPTTSSASALLGSDSYAFLQPYNTHSIQASTHAGAAPDSTSYSAPHLSYPIPQAYAASPNRHLQHQQFNMQSQYPPQAGHLASGGYSQGPGQSFSMYAPAPAAYATGHAGSGTYPPSLQSHYAPSYASQYGASAAYPGGAGQFSPGRAMTQTHPSSYASEPPGYSRQVYAPPAARTTQSTSYDAFASHRGGSADVASHYYDQSSRQGSAGLPHVGISDYGGMLVGVGTSDDPRTRRSTSYEYSSAAASPARQYMPSYDDSSRDPHDDASQYNDPAIVRMASAPVSQRDVSQPPSLSLQDLLSAVVGGKRGDSSTASAFNTSAWAGLSTESTQYTRAAEQQLGSSALHDDSDSEYYEDDVVVEPDSTSTDIHIVMPVAAMEASSDRLSPSVGSSKGAARRPVNVYVPPKRATTVAPVVSSPIVIEPAPAPHAKRGGASARGRGGGVPASAKGGSYKPIVLIHPRSQVTTEAAPAVVFPSSQPTTSKPPPASRGKPRVVKLARS